MSANNFRDILLRAVEVYADGGCIKENPSRFGITWAWCAVDKENNRIAEEFGYIATPKGRDPLTNNHAEQIALVLILEKLPFGWEGKVRSDSQCALGRLFWDWSQTNNVPKRIIERSEKAVKRLGVVSVDLLQGHPTKKELAAGWGSKRDLPVSEHNDYVDKLCKKAAKQYWIDLEKEQEIANAV